ncbi:DsbA family oxidoreductase [Domibacillus enclensis]|uniref:Disulfide bond formation protein DsbA n=1 Tax=Domibacillus enclensis TaxID=1017273 RepID=A0A1N6ZHJ5_9BACI|nr:DsbA family oxidoreductase [Domibacillus enclensis]OXS76708.1 disulfide bond formation protein DsbA [Domibacillus enclensis]SIR26360.1 Predicted dithiol-disulfide isomerase, DsbA family [Domibacillus enclensis]
MKVEIWSDFACPFCYIGKRRFEQAASAFGEKVQVEFRSFELDANAPFKAEEDIHTLLAKKYGMTRDKAKAMNDQLAAQAKEAGLVFHMDTIISANTHDAHRLSHLAKEKGKMNEFTERVLKAYFTDSDHVADQTLLVHWAEEAGLSKEEAQAVLDSRKYSDSVRADQEEAREIGVEGVPFFVFNDKYAVSGAQSVESFTQILEKVAADEKVSAEKTEWCQEDDCTGVDSED